MTWMYRILHSWDEERTQWAEAFVRPDDPGYCGPSLWVTIDCVGAIRRASDEPVRPYDLRAWVGDRPYRVAENGEVGDSDLVVNAHDFTRDEFLNWIQVWLQASGLAVTALAEAPLEEFAGTHPHADLITQLVQRYPADGDRLP